MAAAFSIAGLARQRPAMARHVESGRVPGLVALVSRHGESHIEAIGTMAAGGSEPMREDTIFRIASLTKPITAAATMILVEECRLRLDDPVDEFLPELANRRVLREPGSQLDDTIPASRAITLRDLLTFRFGLGAIMAMPGTYPIQQALADASLEPGPDAPAIAPDEWMRRLGELPLFAQPGEKWMYDMGTNVLGVLISRVSGQTLGEFLKERIFEPLGMADTAFFVPPGKLHRLPPQYVRNQSTAALEVHDDGATGPFSRPPVFESGSSGLVSTASDINAFYRMMLDLGAGPSSRVLSRASVELMTMDHLAPGQNAGDAEIFFHGNRGWGLGMSVYTARTDFASNPGRFGWDGGTGTCGYADPREGLVGVLLTQVMMDSPVEPETFRDFWVSAYQALE